MWQSRGMVWLAVVFLWMVSTAASLQKAELDFEDVWGTLIMQVGTSPQKVKCVASDPDPMGEFLWLLGGKEDPNPSQVEVIGEGSYSQAYSVEPSLDLDGKSITCRYIQRDSDGKVVYETSASLDMQIFIHNLPDDPFNAGVFETGKPAEVSMDMAIYPKPQPEQFTWHLGDGEEQVQLLPGDSMDRYQAKDLESQGDNRYRLTLVIDPLQKDDLFRHVSLMVKENTGQQESRINVTFAILEGDSNEKTTSNSTKGSISGNDKIAEAGSMGVGIWIIVAIIVVILVMCIGYCVYQKKCRKKRGEEEEPQQPGMGGIIRPDLKEKQDLAEKDPEQSPLNA